MPLGSELALENTYPLDPAAGLSLIFCFSMLMGISIIELADLLVTELNEEESELQVRYVQIALKKCEVL